MKFAAGALFVVVVTSLGAGASPLAPLRLGIAVATRAAALSQACPEGMLPDGDACVHLPSKDNDDGEDALVATNAHRERSGRWAVYDQIPRRPDRPADYDAYRYPVPAVGGRVVVSGYDLDRPDESQRRGWSLRAVGHGGVDLPGGRGTEIKLVALEHQQGDAAVVFVGSLFGNTVVTRHTVREGGQLRDYLLLYGHLAGPAPGLVAGATVPEGSLLGYMGDSGSPELVHLHLEARRVRDGIDVTSKSGAQLVDGSVSIVCDPRNILPVK
ncbi:MAG TPA: peptidoglycan DD-metalloendopeptidase family protein [Polyangiaceae bacterium]|nr:peptidoglycan DD-metalloendopeptidase family protein [Polyangiaceae bacterium]